MKKILLPLLAVCFSGCVSTIKHVPLGQTVNVYRPTRFVACDAVGVWWNDSYKSRYPVEAAWMKLTWLVWVVDLPCEVVSDTLWFPYDFYCMKRYEKHQAAKKEKEGRSRFGSVKCGYTLDGDYTLDIDE